MASVLNIAALVGLVVGAGFCGGWVARHKAPEVEGRTEAPWSWWDRAIRFENVGFLCGAAGGAAALLATWAWGWLRIP